MAEENISQVKEMIADENCCSKPMKIIEETMPLLDEEKIAGDDDVLLLPPPAVTNHVNPRRNSTGGLDKRGPSKAQAQTRYRGNQMGSTHDLCKHGKRREDDLVIKPWKLVKKKNVESGDLGKVETLNATKKEKPLQAAKREAASEIVKSPNGLRVKRSETKKSTTSPSETKREAASEIVKSPNGLRVKRIETKITTTMPSEVRKKVSRISENKSSKEDLLKNLKNKEKKKTIDEPIRCEDIKEKTLYVLESSIEEKKKIKKSIKSNKSDEIQQSSDKKILRSSEKKSVSLLPSLSPSSKEVKGSRVARSDPRPIIRNTTTKRSKTGLTEKKEVGSANLVTNSKTESKIIKPKRIGLKVTPPPALKRQVSFKKGKVLEPKPEDSTSTSIKFKKRVVQEPKLRSDVNKKKKKSLKDKREGFGKMSIMNGEGKREKVVLRHRKVEARKKLQTLFNNVIEETVSKLEDVRKSKVKALVGAFETVISLQDDKTKSSQKKMIQSKSQVVEGG